MINNQISENRAEKESLDALINKLEEQGKLLIIKHTSIEENILLFTASLDDPSMSDSDNIKLKIQELIDEVNDNLLKIDELIMHNQDNEAMELAAKISGLNIQLALYNDMQSVQSNKKYYADANGLKVESFKQSYFILDNDQKIVTLDGKHYLLKPGQTLDTIKENKEAKEEAQKLYEYSKQELITVKNVVQLNKPLETTFIHQQLDGTKNKLTLNHNEHLVLENQCKLLQSAKAEAVLLLNQPELNKEPSAPTATAGNSSTPKPNLAAATLFYRQQIKLLKQSGEITPQNLIDLVKMAPGDKKSAELYLKGVIAGMAPTKPITDLTLLQTMLKNLKALGLRETAPMSKMSEFIAVKEKTNEPNLTPFKMTPGPYKKS